MRVSTVDELFHAVENAAPGLSILIEDGHYYLPRYLEIRADNVALRGASGDRHAVILDGARSRHGELVGMRDCSDAMIADLTIRNVTFNGIKINNDHNVQRPIIRNCVIHNVWQRGVKSVRAPNTPSRGGVIEYCLFYNDRPKRFEDDPTDTEETFGGDYVGAVDLMDAHGWTIRDNAFINIQGRNRVGRGAIFIWMESRDIVIERNLIVDCDAGVSLGNAHKPENVEYHCEGFIVRNNFITRAPMQAIHAAYTRDCLVIHNSIHDPENRFGRSIRAIFDNPGLAVINNLVDGPQFRFEQMNTELIEQRGNLQGDFSHYFTDALAGDLRLTDDAIDAFAAAEAHPAVEDDILREPRGDAPDAGAHQFSRRSSANQ